MNRLWYWIGTAFIGGSLVLAGCGGSSGENTSDPRDASTRAMAEELAELSTSQKPEANPYANSERIEHFEAQPTPEDPVEASTYTYKLGQEYLRAGSTRVAIQLFQDVYRRMADHPQRYTKKQFLEVTERLGLAWLRYGEQQNCLRNHTSKSCILPIQGEGVHDRPKGSRNAIRHFTDLLDRQPDNLNTRWLLNIAYMTLGEYPDEVPREWRVPLGRADTTTEVEPFRDIAPALGVDVMDLSGGTVVEDFTGDGYLDIMLSSWNLDDQVRFFVNNGDGTFTEKTREAGLKGITGGLNLRHADYTNDGYPDVLVLRGAWRGEQGTYPNSLLRNNGDTTFTDVTRSAGVYRRLPTQTATWGDYNNDGAVDLFVGNETTEGQVSPSALYRNEGDGTFTNVTDEVGLHLEQFVKGVAWGDYNNDGRPDLYVSILNDRNRLYRNDGRGPDSTWTFTDVTEEAGVGGPETSFPVWFWDYNNDGHLDLFVSGYERAPGDVAREYLGKPLAGTALPRLYRNDGDGTFTDVAGEANLDKVLYTMGSNYGDVNNDGWLDFYVGTGDPDLRSLEPSRMFLNQNGASYAEVTRSAQVGNIQKGHAVAFADFNHDGHQDLYVNMGGALEGDTYQNLFFKNPGTANNSLVLRLVGDESNRMGIGARVKAVVGRGDSTRTLHRVVSAGSSFGGNPFRVHLGLGTAESVSRLVIRWPTSGTRQVFTDVAPNQHIQIREGADTLARPAPPSFSYRTTADTSEVVPSASGPSPR